jgi:uncharacterized protein YjcR
MNGESMAVDWPAVRHEYISGDITLPELAEKHGIYPATLAKCAAKENWEEERAQAKALAHDAASDARNERLVRFNEDDLQVARAVRAKAAQMIQTASTPQEISALAKAFDIAHKIGRIALGADAEK